MEERTQAAEATGAPDRPGAPEAPEEWAGLLKGNWERLARTEYRDFFVASHAGWDDPRQWEETARRDLDAMLEGYDRTRLATTDVLEIGCGVGRLAKLLAPEVESYTGIDIAPSMLAEAGKRCAEHANARFLETDGLTVPAGARDRAYGLILTASVLIHCPREVIESLVRDGSTLLAPGGRFHFHVLADPYDPGGFASDEAYAESRDALLAEMQANADATVPEQMALLPKEHYMGASFGFAELGEFLSSASGGTVEAKRLSIGHIAGHITR